MRTVAPRYLAALFFITLILGLNLIVSKICLATVPPMSNRLPTFTRARCISWQRI